MIRINLLPYRAERRKQRKVQFAALSGFVLLLSLMVAGAGHMWIDAKIEHQQARNDYLRQQTAELDRQIKEIDKLQKETEALLARKTVVEDLQSTRASVVHLLDQVLRILPEDIYLSSLKQAGDEITISGFARTNARVSTLMRAVDASPWLDKPTLVEISASAAPGGARQSAFTMKFMLVKDKTQAAAPAEGGQ